MNRECWNRRPKSRISTGGFSDEYEFVELVCDACVRVISRWKLTGIDCGLVDGVVKSTGEDKFG